MYLRLKPLDIEIMKRLGTRVNLIPVIAKADTLTQNDLFTFKQRVRSFCIKVPLAAVAHGFGIRSARLSLLRASASISRPGTPTTLLLPRRRNFWLRPFPSRSLAPRRMFARLTVALSRVASTCGVLQKARPFIPPDYTSSHPSNTVENDAHCDFRKLRALLIRTHMLDLISTTEELHYENYRQQQMETRKFGEPKVKKVDNPKFKEEEEALRKRFTEQVKAEEVRFRQWEQHVCHSLNVAYDPG